MRRALIAVLLVTLASAQPALAQGGRATLGYGRLFTNDFLGDNQDRWRTGSYAVSKVTGFGWGGRLPGRPGEILEYRLRAEVIAPDNSVTPAPGDRRFSGNLSFGLHTHFRRRTAEVSAGVDLVATGPQTGIGELVDVLHPAFGAPKPGMLGNQIPNGLHPTLTFELGRTLEVGPALSLRPFAEVKAGAETFVRIGGDVTFGPFGRGALMLRDEATGHRYRVTDDGAPGLSFLLGADVAHVADSVFLPASGGYALTDSRTRLRAGVQWQGERRAVFYGLTWLGREFEAQPEGQVVGSLRVKMRF